MLKRLLGAALLFCVSGAAHAEPSARSVLSEPGSMRFEWVREGPADVCGAHCREWIAAVGPITADTAQDFEFFSQVRDLRGATLVLDSGGGSVLASLELGRKVRHLGMTTTVGHITRLSGPGDEQRGRLSARGECASMCVFVLLGGVKRQVPAEARILVHQIWPGGKRYDAGAETYTAEEMARIQRDVGRIARYTVEMGGDIELFELAMRIPPWERLRALSQAELRRVGLQSLDIVAEASTSGAAAAGRPAKSSPARIAERGWTLVEASRPAALQRRHALTIEGEEIGQFEITLACADPGKSYKLAYAESRLVADDSASVQVKAVTLLLGGERVALTVDSSASRGDAAELASHASGTVTADFIEKLRKDPESVMIVGTRTTDNVRTSIRVGSTGFGKAFSRFATDCGKK